VGAKNEKGECLGGAWGEVEGTPLKHDVLVQEAVKKCAFESFRVLVDDGNRLPYGDIEGGRALRTAAGVGDEKTVRLLLLGKANVDSCDEKNRTALWIAAAAGHGPTIQFLCESKADTNRVDCWEQSALCIAARNQWLDSVLVLCNAGVDCNAIPRGRFNNPAIIAASNGAVLILEVLHNAGMTLSKPVDDHGWTVAHSAAKYSQERVLRFLKEIGLHIQDDIIKSAADITSIHVSEASEKLEKHRALERQKTDVNVCELLRRHYTQKTEEVQTQLTVQTVIIIQRFWRSRIERNLSRSTCL